METTLTPNGNLTQRDLWMVRAYYFAMVGGGGFLAPFLNLFFTRQNLGGFEIGLIVSIGSVVGLIAAPAWARWSSQSRRPLRLLQVGLVLMAILTIFLSQQRLFLWLSFFFALRVAAGAGISPLSDALALRVTTALKAGYGSVRVWGSFGWAVLVLSSGWLNDHFGIHSAFIGSAVALVVAAILLMAVGKAGDSSRPPAGAPRSGFRQVAGRILHNRGLVGLGIMLVIIGIGNIGVNQFENIYLSQLGARDSLIGVASMASSVVEIPGMLWADSMVRRHSPAVMLLVSLGMSCVLRILVFFFPSVILIMAVKASGGVAFSFYTVALIKYIGERTLSHETGTALAIFTVTVPSIINIAATPLAGIFFDHLGANGLYLVSFLGYVLGAIILKSVLPPASMADRWRKNEPDITFSYSCSGSGVEGIFGQPDRPAG